MAIKRNKDQALERKKAQQEARAALKTAEAQMTAGLKVIEQEEADAIIGEPGQGYKELIQGLQAVNTMAYAILVRKGLKNRPDVQDVVAKASAMGIQLVHNAYAVGIREGMERKEENDAADQTETT